jgi:hypothetical protein
MIHKHFKTKAKFSEELAKSPSGISDSDICFIKDTGEIWTHGKFYAGSDALSEQKADKVASATSGNFAGLDANGNLTDSGYRAASFQVAGSYKTTQSSVSDPSVDGTGLTFIDSISQNTNGVITPHKKTVANVVASESGVGGSDGLMSAADKEKLDDIGYATDSDIEDLFT